MSLAIASDLLEDFGQNVTANVIANLFCLGLPLIGGFFLYRLLVRRRVRKFFGLAEGGDGSVQIRLSSIDVAQSRAASPLSSKGFTGTAITAAEYQYALHLVAAIQSRPIAGAAYALAETAGMRVVARPVACRISASLPYHAYLGVLGGPTLTDQPLIAEIEHTLSAYSTFVLVGSSVYNVLTRYVLQEAEQLPATFAASSAEVGGSASAIRIQPSHGSPIVRERTREQADGVLAYRELFMLQKVTRWGGVDKTILIAAGTSTAATAAALSWLADRWRKLADEFGPDRPFAVVYSFLTLDQEVLGPYTEHAPWRSSLRREWPTEK